MKLLVVGSGGREHAVIRKLKENNEIVIILKVQKQIEELINYRKITFDLIWWSASGLKVPNQAIVQENDLNYVIRNRAGYLSKILVKVKKQGDKYSIVDSYTNEEKIIKCFNGSSYGSWCWQCRRDTGKS